MKHLPQNSEVRAEMCRRDFYFFVREFWDTIIPDNAVYNWHIQYLCGELQKMAERVKQRLPKEYDLIINIPPGTTKSTICTIMFPVWCWTIDPSMRFITGSYSYDLSTDHAVKSRDIIRSDRFVSYFPDLFMKDDKDNKTAYENNYMGSRSSTSVGGTITGKHANLIVIDDPLNPKKAASEVERNNANDWMDRTLSSRKVDKEITPTILVMQRLHENDCTGHWLSKKEKRIKHICLPAELSDNVSPVELREKYVDGLLDPVRLNKKVLLEQRIDYGSYAYSGQMSQRPAPDDGGIIKKNWFTIISQSTFDEQMKTKQVVWDFFLDSAYTNKTKNDPSALMAVAKIDHNTYIKSSKQVWMEFPELINEIVQFTAKNGYTRQSKIYIEPKASGLTIIQTLKRETNLNIISLDPPKDDKVTRVHGVSPVIESGRVFLISGEWNEGFLNECAAFPNGNNDDQVDNLSAMLNKYFGKNTTFGAPRITLNRI